MTNQYSALMQSKYFSPEFNTALFDGPLRAYFAQAHEETALQLYFLIQETHREIWADAKIFSKKNNSHFLVVIYPTESLSAELVAQKKQGQLNFVEFWNGDCVFGFSQEDFASKRDLFVSLLAQAMKNWMQETLFEENPRSMTI